MGAYLDSMEFSNHKQSVWHKWISFTERFDNKVRKILCVQEIWPVYCTFKEGKNLMNEKWKVRYSSARIIQWDNNSVWMSKLRKVNMQQTTYSLYYSSNCVKGAVMLLLCGWMGVKCVFPGGISVSEYMIKSGFFRSKWIFQITTLQII